MDSEREVRAKLFLVRNAVEPGGLSSQSSGMDTERKRTTSSSKGTDRERTGGREGTSKADEEGGRRRRGRPGELDPLVGAYRDASCGRHDSEGGEEVEVHLVRAAGQWSRRVSSASSSCRGGARRGSETHQASCGFCSYFLISSRIVLRSWLRAAGSESESVRVVRGRRGKGRRGGRTARFALHQRKRMRVSTCRAHVEEGKDGAEAGKRKERRRPRREQTTHEGTWSRTRSGSTTSLRSPAHSVREGVSTLCTSWEGRGSSRRSERPQRASSMSGEGPQRRGRRTWPPILASALV